MTTPATRSADVDVSQLPPGDLLPWALGYQAMIASNVCFSVLLAFLFDSPVTMVILWLVLSRPLGLMVGGLFALYAGASSAVLVAAALASFQIDWRLGVGGLILVAVLFVMGISTAARWELLRKSASRAGGSAG